MPVYDYSIIDRGYKSILDHLDAIKHLNTGYLNQEDEHNLFAFCKHVSEMDNDLDYIGQYFDARAMGEDAVYPPREGSVFYGKRDDEMLEDLSRSLENAKENFLSCLSLNKDCIQYDKGSDVMF